MATAAGLRATRRLGMLQAQSTHAKAVRRPAQGRMHSCGSHGRMHSCGSHVRTMNDSVAAVAPVVPPDTGASTMAGDAPEQPGTGVAARRSCALAA